MTAYVPCASDRLIRLGARSRRLEVYFDTAARTGCDMNHTCDSFAGFVAVCRVRRISSPVQIGSQTGSSRYNGLELVCSAEGERNSSA